MVHHGASLAVETRLFGFIIPGLLLQSSQQEKLGSTAIHRSSDSYCCGPMYPIIYYRGVLRSRIHGRDVLKHRYLYNYVPYSAVMQDITHARSWDTVHSCRVQGYISPQSPQDGVIAAGGGRYDHVVLAPPPNIQQVNSAHPTASPYFILSTYMPILGHH